MNNKKVEISVGIFMLCAFLALLFIFLKVTDLGSLRSQSTYRLTAVFDNIGSLKARSPVKLGGVIIGRVSEITLDKTNYLPKVIMDIQSQYDQIPNNSALSIKTAGLLGDQYISVNFGFYDEDIGVQYFKNGDSVHDTKPAMVVEDLIGQFLYKDDASSASKSGAK